MNYDNYWDEDKLEFNIMFLVDVMFVLLVIFMVMIFIFIYKEEIVLSFGLKIVRVI